MLKNTTNVCKNAQNCAKNCVKIQKNWHSWKKLAQTASPASPSFSISGRNMYRIFMIIECLPPQDKPHKCGLCSKSFPTPGDLKAHQFVHRSLHYTTLTTHFLYMNIKHSIHIYSCCYQICWQIAWAQTNSC